MTNRTEAALDLLASLTDHVGRWWTCAVDVQRDDARAILSTDGPRRHWLGRSKGFSKTRDVAGMSIVALTQQMDPGEMAYAAAADQEQAGLLRQSVAAFRSHTPALERAITVESRRVVARSGAELVILAADTAGSHGLRPKWLVLDELSNWPAAERHEEFADSLLAGLPKVAESRCVVITTAGAPSHWSRRIFDAASGSPLWRLSDVHGPPPWTDPAEVEAERQRQLPSRFARLWMNEWAEPDDALVTPEDLAAAQVLDGPLEPRAGVRYVVTLDVGLVNDRTVLVVAHRDEGGRVVVDQLLRWQGTRQRPVDLDEITEAIADANRRYPGIIRIDPAKAEHLLQRLIKRGLPIRKVNFTTASVGLLASSLVRALRMHALLLPQDRMLRDELLAVRIQENSAGVPRLTHSSSGHDDQAVALALTTYALTDDNYPKSAAVLYSDDEMAAFRAAQLRAQLDLPKPVPIISNLGIAGTHRMATALGTFDDADDRPNGRTARSPFGP